MKTRIFCIFLGVLLLLPTPSPVKAADSSSDNDVRYREEEIRVKEAQAEELSNRILGMQKQLEEDRKGLSKSQEKIWNEFTQGVEAERKSIQEKLGSLDQRQKAFENELQRKRQEDEVRIKDKETEAARLSAQVDRLRGDIENDRQILQARLVEIRNEKAAAAAADPASVKGGGSPSEVLPNQAIKISKMSGEEMMGHASPRARRVHGEYYLDLG